MSKKQIDVKQTVTNILAVENVQFKLLKQDQEKNTALLVTPTDDNFQRGLITIDVNQIALGVQSPDKDGVITLTLQPTPVEILELVALVEVTEDGDTNTKE